METSLTIREQQELFEWIPLSRYLLMFPEDNANAIRARRHRGIWLDGVHINVQTGMGTWVNLHEVKKMIMGPKRRSAPAAAAAEIEEPDEIPEDALVPDEE